MIETLSQNRCNCTVENFKALKCRGTEQSVDKRLVS